jgi:hypothetical protein
MDESHGPREPQEPAQRKKRRIYLFVAVGLVLVLGGAVLARTFMKPKHTIIGTLTEPCSGDVTNGTTATLKDSSGTIVATASLHTSGQPSGTIAPNCTYAWTFSDVPDEDFYTVPVGSHDGPTYSRQDLAEANWRISLLL